VKTQSKGTNVPTPAPEALDEKITQLTEEVAKKAKTYWVPVLIAIIVVFAFMAVSSLMSSITEGQQQDLSESVYALFNSGKTPEEIRSQAPQLGESLRGKPIEAYFVVTYAQWLYGQGEGDDRAKAIELMEEALPRQETFAGQLLLELQLSEHRSAMEVSKDFVLPEIPAPPEPEAAGESADSGAATDPLDSITVTGTSGVSATIQTSDGTTIGETIPTEETEANTDGDASEGGAEPAEPAATTGGAAEAPEAGDGGL